MEENKTLNDMVEEIRQIIGPDYQVEPLETEGNNGVMRHFITIRKPGEGACPAIRMDDLPDALRPERVGPKRAAQEIAYLFHKKCLTGETEAVSGIVNGLDKRGILERVTCQVINREKNAGRLAGMPYEEFLDLAVVYRAFLRDFDPQNGSMLMTNELCERYGISPEELGAAARRNMERAGTVMRPIESILEEMTGLTEEELGSDHPLMWIISNASMQYGASVLIHDGCGCLGRLADQLGSDLYVFPSSVHEVIAVPAGRKATPEALREMVREINAEEVAREDVLSDNVYRYGREDGRLTIA